MNVRKKLHFEPDKKREKIQKMIIYPLPEAPDEQCRDAFLRQIFEPYERYQSSELTIQSEYSSEMQNRSQHKLGINLYDPDEKLVTSYERNARLTVYHKKAIKMSLGDSRVTAPNINKLLRDRYGNIATAIGVVAVLCLLTDVKHRMSVVRSMWRHESNVDRNLRMFSWSIHDYLLRFQRRNENYLDAVEWELKGQMDCFKFRMDLKEIIRLVDAIYDDYRARRNFCESCLLSIR